MTKKNIIPAILPNRFDEIEASVKAVEGTVDTVQLDIVDGVFAPNKTWLFNGKDASILQELEAETRGMPRWETMNYELDLMVKDPLTHIEHFLMLGPSKVIFHLESVKESELLQYFETLSEVVRTTISFGMAISIGTPPEDIAPFAPFISTIQCMGISDIGFQGQAFNVDALAQIRRAKELYPDKRISVDGGVNAASIPLIIEAGADTLVIGSALFGNDNPRGTIQVLNRLCEEAKRQGN